jgi:hypothetical protein
LFESQLKAAREFTIQIGLMNRVMGYLAKTVAASAAPAMKVMVTEFSNFLKRNREFIQIGLRNVVDGIAEGFYRFWDGVLWVKNGLSQLFPELAELVKKLGGVDKISFAVQVALAGVAGGLIALGLATAAALWPWLLLVAAVTAAYLAFDDIKTFMEGGKSLTGEFIKKVKELTEKIKDLADAFKNRWPNITKLLSEVWDLLSKIDQWSGVDLVQTFRDLWEALKGIAGAVSTGLSKILDVIDKALTLTLGDLFSGGVLGHGFGPMPDEIPNWARVPAAQTGGSTVINNNLNQQIQGPNPSATADEVKRRAGGFFFSNNPGDFAPVAQ